MTISEFEKLVSIHDLINEYLLFCKKNRHMSSFSDFAGDAALLFKKNRHSIVNSFFDHIHLILKNSSPEVLNRYVFIFFFEPFSVKDHLQAIVILCEKINTIIKNETETNADLLDFYWLFIDHLYHNDFHDRLSGPLMVLKEILIRKKESNCETDLLMQKITQHYNL